MKVVIIYNPNSTGGSKENAQQLAKALKALKVEVTVRKTTHPGHGREIAMAFAKRDEPCVLISSSGDGGYHEVINGALAYPTKKFTVGVLASGNANDHATALSNESVEDFARTIKSNKHKKIDTISVSGTVKGKQWTRFAHSYVGLGVTAVAAKQLTVDRPNIITEKWIVIKALFSFKYIKLQEGSKTRRYSSIIFGNIDRMSKVVKLSDDASVTDGKFEMTSIRFRSKLRLLTYIVTATTVGLRQTRSLSSYSCITPKPLSLQLDGEVYTVDAGSTLEVKSMKQNLRCIL